MQTKTISISPMIWETARQVAEESSLSVSEYIRRLITIDAEGKKREKLKLSYSKQMKLLSALQG
jgi:predicted CopG family antitoxin